MSMPTKSELLAVLPPYNDTWVVIEENQEVVKDIIPEMLAAYEEFKGLYDKIGLYFADGTLQTICRSLYAFCEKYIKYREEPEEWQTTAVPQGYLTRGYGDCKAYASFIGGCLGAIARLDNKFIDWDFCFASYDLAIQTPYHVFVIVNTRDGEIWIDPTPGADGKEPVWIIKEKPESMALARNVGALVRNIGNHTVGASPEYGTFAPGSPNYNVPASALPVPDNYPSHLPRPHIVNGKLQFNRIPPNFDPSFTEIAWMMYPLQLWVNTYSPKPYNVFTWNENVDGQGVGIADLVGFFCKYYRNPDNYAGGMFGIWVTPPPPPPKQPKRDPYFEPKYWRWVPGVIVTVGAGVGVEKYDPVTGDSITRLSSDEIKLQMTTNSTLLFAIKSEAIDFLTMPEPWDDHGWDVTGAIVGAVVKAMFALVPYVGPVFVFMLNQMDKDAAMQDAINDANQSGAIADVAEQIGAEIEANKARKKKAIIVSTGIFALSAIAAALIYYQDDL